MEKHEKEVSKRKNNKLKTIKSINSLTDGTIPFFHLRRASHSTELSYLFVAWSIKWPMRASFACEKGFSF